MKAKEHSEYKGKAPLLTIKEADEILNWKDKRYYDVIHQNGFLDVYHNGKNFVFPESQIKALSKCHLGSLMLYEGAKNAEKNALIYEEELKKIESNY